MAVMSPRDVIELAAMKMPERINRAGVWDSS
jgi:hypothetical protein